MKLSDGNGKDGNRCLEYETLVNSSIIIHSVGSPRLRKSLLHHEARNNAKSHRGFSHLYLLLHNDNLHFKLTLHRIKTHQKILTGKGVYLNTERTRQKMKGASACQVAFVRSNISSTYSMALLVGHINWKIKISCLIWPLIRVKMDFFGCRMKYIYSPYGPQSGRRLDLVNIFNSVCQSMIQVS